MSDSPDTSKFSVADAPSVGADPNANPHAFKPIADVQYQTIIPPGMVSKDQVFGLVVPEEAINEQAVKQYASFLTLSNKVRPATSLSETDFSINQQYVDEAKKRRKRALELITGSSFTEEDLIVAAKSTSGISPLSFTPTAPANSETTSPTVVSKDFTGLPVAAGVYKYNQIELFDDRYDFETGKKIRVGIAGGIGGGAGDNTTAGNTQPVVEQQESPANTTSETPVVGNEDDPCD